MTLPIPAPRAAPRTPHSVSRTFYVVITVIPAIALVAYLIGSLLLSGGQVSASMDAKWDPVIPYPLFPAPTAVLVSLAAISAALAMFVALTARAGDELGQRGVLGPTAAAMVSAFGFSLLVPDGGTRSGDTVFGGQWVAAVVYAVALVVLFIGAGVSTVRTRRRARADA